MGLLDKLGGEGVAAIFGGLRGVIDEFRVTEDEKVGARTELLRVENELTAAVLQYEADIANAKRDVIVAEAKSVHRITAIWRPLIMLTLGAILVYEYVAAPIIERLWGVPQTPIDPGMWVLLQIGIGGYIAGRSGEKIVQTVRGTKPVATQVDANREQRRMVKAVGKQTRKLRRAGLTQSEIDQILDTAREEA